MRIIRLQVEGFKRLVAVDITPEGDLIEVRGENGHGKSSVLDSIYAALDGAGAAPEMPVREGEEAAVIRLDLGELVVTRYFTTAGTTGLKVTTPDGASYGGAQTMLDKLIGAISFDPLAFRDLKPEDQAEELRKLVDISDPETGEVLDLAKLATARKELFDRRAEVNREGKSVKARIEALGGVRFVPDDAPDRDQLREALANAATTNSAIDAEERRRAMRADEATSFLEDAANADRRAEEARAALERAEADAKAFREARALILSELERLPPLDERVDVAKLSEDLRQADVVAENVRVNDERARMVGEFDQLKADSTALTEALAKHDADRARAIAAAKMPVEGLALVMGEDDKLGVTFNGVPFSQASDAERLRVSAAVAMAANPQLRVLRLKDASLLDKRAIATLREMATANDFQIWAEFVGDEGPGIVMEAGEVRGAAKPEPLPKPKTRKAKESDDADGTPPPPQTDRVVEEGAAAPVAKAAAPDTDRPGTLFERMARPEPSTAAEPERQRPRAMRSFSTRPLDVK